MIAEGAFGTGILTFQNVVIPNPSVPGGDWSTSIWIDVYSQCAWECGHGFWWKFEKPLSAAQAYAFAQHHNNPDISDEYVDGTRVKLEFMGTVPCNYWEEYGC